MVQCVEPSPFGTATLAILKSCFAASPAQSGHSVLNSGPVIRRTRGELSGFHTTASRSTLDGSLPRG